MRSQSPGCLREPAFIEINKVGHCENVCAIGDAVLLFPFLQHRSERIAPSEFRHESIPDKQVTLIRLPAALKAPLKDFFVSSALQYALAKIVIVDTQEIAASAIKRSRRTEILMIVLVQLTPRVQPNLLQHSREIHHSTRHFFRAFWVCRHGAVNGKTFVSAIFPVENCSIAAGAPRHSEVTTTKNARPKSRLDDSKASQSIHIHSLHEPKTAEEHNCC